MLFFEIGGAKEDRTPDLLNAIQALSQLSYNPKNKRNIKNLFLNVKSFLSSADAVFMNHLGSVFENRFCSLLPSS